MRSKTAFLGTGADTSTVYALYEALASLVSGPVLTMRFADVRAVWGMKRESKVQAGWQDLVVPVPPAYATRLHWLTRSYLTHVISRRYAEIAASAGTQPFLILTNPAMERWTRAIPDQCLIYWNFDDYRLFQPERAGEIEAWEAALIERARLVLCASRTQQTRFRDWLPQHAEKIHHFPNAVRCEWILDTSSVKVAAGTVGYVGNMGERVDWTLVHDTARACPDRRFVFVGGVERATGSPSPQWARARGRALALPNVESIGRVPQAEVWRWYQSFELGWMPYDTRHPFNIACCPTKIFDALAAGRPFVTTAVPECLLYPDKIALLSSATNAPAVFARTLADWMPARAADQLAFARANDWHARAQWLLDQLENTSA